MEVLKEYLAQADEFAEKIIIFIRSKGVEVKSSKFSDILKGLEELYVLQKQKEYIAVDLDRKGFIKLYNNMDEIIEAQDLPEDILRGYYKIKNNKVVLDKKRQKELWGD
jgi:hypothetical protein